MTEEAKKLWIPCPTCRGWGSITRKVNIYDHLVKVPCPQCAGKQLVSSCTGLPPFSLTVGEELLKKNQV